MKNFQCGGCGGRVFFENSICLTCRKELGFVPEDLRVGTFEPAAADGTMRRIDGEGLYRRCSNHTTGGGCSWAVPVESAVGYCLACRLSRIIPDLSKPRNARAWLKLETAKRRLIYSLLSLGLPVCPKSEDPAGGLAFDFLEDAAPGTLGGDHVFTGHAGGLITINLDEADDPTREKARQLMGEMYRTVLGHFRHEVGHHYWDLLVARSPHLNEFRRLFGDETMNYNSALAMYYSQGPPADWRVRHVSPYAAAHPWEDWAETWAHYLHIMDTLETAAAEGMVIRKSGLETLIGFPLGRPFADIVAQWREVSLLLNGLNRSMGLADPYPFALAETVVLKLTLIHDWIALWNQRAPVDNAPAG